MQYNNDSCWQLEAKQRLVLLSFVLPTLLSTTTSNRYSINSIAVSRTLFRHNLYANTLVTVVIIRATTVLVIMLRT